MAMVLSDEQLAMMEASQATSNDDVITLSTTDYRVVEKSIKPNLVHRIIDFMRSLRPTAVATA